METLTTTINRKPSKTIHKALIEVTDHSLYQLVTRYFFNSYSYIISSREILLYPDVNNSNVFYFNIEPTGYVVLRKLKDKFVIITITLDEHRNYGQPIKLTKPRLRQRQEEYEL